MKSRKSRRRRLAAMIGLVAPLVLTSACVRDDPFQTENDTSGGGIADPGGTQSAGSGGTPGSGGQGPTDSGGRATAGSSPSGGLGGLPGGATGGALLGGAGAGPEGETGGSTCSDGCDESCGEETCAQCTPSAADCGLDGASPRTCNDGGKWESGPACSANSVGCAQGRCRCAAGWSGPTCATCVVHVVSFPNNDDNDKQGTSWQDAFDELSDALDRAEVRHQQTGLRCQVWLQEGTYRLEALGDTFRMRSGVDIYGGFEGDEGELGERDWEQHPTTLSGDVSGNDSTSEWGVSSRNENAYHVLIGADDARLDGVTVRGGHAAGTPTNQTHAGGGMINDGVSPTIQNVVFFDNYAAEFGGGMYNTSGAAPRVEDCRFETNGAGLVDLSAGLPTRGGGMCNDEGASPTIVSTRFEKNETSRDGGGIANLMGTKPLIQGCVFRENAAQSGGGIFNENSEPRIEASTFNSNFSYMGGGIFNNNEDLPELVPQISDCKFVLNHATTPGGGGIANSSSSPHILDCVFEENGVAAGGAIWNNNAHPTIARSTFHNNNGSLGGAIHNYYSNPVISQSTFTENTAQTGGAIHNESSNPEISGSIFLQNDVGWAQGWGGAILNYESSPIIVSSLFALNTAYLGGALYNEEFSFPSLINCTATKNLAEYYFSGSALHARWDSRPRLLNTILWDNGAQPLFADDGSGYEARHCLLDASSEEITESEGLLIVDEAGFVDAGTLDFRLLSSSPAVDAGSVTHLPPDSSDLDQDGETTEPIPYDLDGQERILGQSVDLGAFERK